MPDEITNPADERAFAAFLDRLVAGEPGDNGVDPALAETARDLQDRAARSTASAPPAGTLVTIRADLFARPVAAGRHRAALGIVPGPALLTRPAMQLALAAAVLLAVLTGVATFGTTGWLGHHAPAGTHSALAASATAPFAAQLTMSPGTGDTTAYVASATASPSASPAGTRSPEVRSLLKTCPMSASTVIPGAEGFTPWGLGKAPLWIDGWGNPPKELQDQFPVGSLPAFMGPQFAGPTWEGWSMRALWIMDGSATEPVSIVGRRTNDNAAMWFSQEIGSSTTDLRLDPAKPGIPVQHGSFREWPTSAVFPGTGCYEITATWKGGSWTEQIPVIVPPNTANVCIATVPAAKYATPSNKPVDNPCATDRRSSTPKPATPVASPVPATPSAGVTCALPDARAIDLPIGRGGQVIHAWGLGTSPLWLVGLGNPPSWYHPTDPGFVITGSKPVPGADGRPGARLDVLWLMDPAHPQPVNVRGKSVDGNADLFFQTSALPGDDKEPSFTPGGMPGVAYMWWTTMIYTQPGCYEITATWASGSWTVRLPLPPPTTTIATPNACATPGATPGLSGSPWHPAQSLMQPPPPFATKQPPIPYITPGIQQILTPPGVPLITPTPFATIVGPAATPTTPAPCGG